MNNFTRPGLTTIAVLLTVLVVLLCSGCASLPPSTYVTPSAHRAEVAWQAMAAYDTAQTVSIARSPTCWREADPLAAAVYGSDHPSTSRVLATNALLSWGHYELGGWLDRHTQAAIGSDSPNRGLWYVGRVAFYTASFLGTGLAIGNNQSLGIRPFTTKVCN